MSMNETQASAFAKSALDKLSTLFYGGDTPYACDLPMVPVVKAERGATPNGNLTPTDDGSGLGMVVSDGLLNITDDVTIKFALVHELGHGTSEHILKHVGLEGVGGEATEVIADLSAAYILAELGTRWDTIIASISQWRKTKIFDEHKDGDHPPGDERVAYVKKLQELLGKGASFHDAAKQICKPIAS